MIYAYDRGVQLPISSIYDTQMMLAQVAAAKDMYEKAALEMKDFKKEYGDFYSPFQKDMERYSLMVGGVLNIIQDAYNNGIDLARSPEGRRMIRKAINSINIGEYNAMKANAKIGYAYLDALLKLRSLGKYSEAQELFDITNSGGTKFSDFLTLRGDGTFNAWDRTSPIEAVSLRDLTYKNYEHRTPRDLTIDDFKNDPSLRGMQFDPRYQYTGYLDSDLMKVAPGASASLAGDPRAAFFRDQARLKVAALGGPVTEEAVEAQFLRDIADANKWALVDPTKKVDEYAKMAQQNAYARDLENLRAKNDKEIAQIKAGTKDGDTSGGYANIISNAASGKLRSHNMIIASKLKDEDYKAVLDINDDNEKIKAVTIKGYLNYFNEDREGGSIKNRIKNLRPGQGGVSTLNEILSLRAVGGNVFGDSNFILPASGFEPDDNGWFKVTGESKIVSAHQLMKNIIEYETPFVGDNTKEWTKDYYGTWKKDRREMIEKLDDVESKDDLWINATTKERARRTKAVKPLTTRGNGYIVAPDENGVKHVYMKVEIKQGASFNDPGSWLPQGNHGGFWVETSIGQNPDGTINLESVPTTYMQEALERHTLSNAGVSQSYGDARF